MRGAGFSTYASSQHLPVGSSGGFLPSMIAFIDLGLTLVSSHSLYRSLGRHIGDYSLYKSLDRLGAWADYIGAKSDFEDYSDFSRSQNVRCCDVQCHNAKLLLSIQPLGT